MRLQTRAVCALITQSRLLIQHIRSFVLRLLCRAAVAETAGVPLTSVHLVNSSDAFHVQKVATDATEVENLPSDQHWELETVPFSGKLAVKSPASQHNSTHIISCNTQVAFSITVVNLAAPYIKLTTSSADNALKSALLRMGAHYVDMSLQASLCTLAIRCCERCCEECISDAERR